MFYYMTDSLSQYSAKLAILEKCFMGNIWLNKITNILGKALFEYDKFIKLSLKELYELQELFKTNVYTCTYDKKLMEMIWGSSSSFTKLRPIK